MATGQVLFHRFYCKKSFARFNVKVPIVCLLLLILCLGTFHLNFLFNLWWFMSEFIYLQRVAASCVWLASKLEESPRKARQVIIVFHRMECRRENLPIEHLDTSLKVSSGFYCSEIVIFLISIYFFLIIQRLFWVLVHYS